MASERLFEVARRRGARADHASTRRRPVRLLDFLGAPTASFPSSTRARCGIALQPWFDAGGPAPATSRSARRPQRRGFFDRMVGLELLRRHGPILSGLSPSTRFPGARRRGAAAAAGAPDTAVFVLVQALRPPARRDTMFFARRLSEAGYRLGPVVATAFTRPSPASPASRRRQPSDLEMLLGSSTDERADCGHARRTSLCGPKQPDASGSSRLSRRLAAFAQRGIVASANRGGAGKVGWTRLTTTGPSHSRPR